MPLQKQVVSLPFTKGLDTKTDAKLSAKPSRLENAVFRGGTLQKPYGSTALASAIDTGGNQTKGEALFAFDSELVRINGGTTYSYGQTLSEWVTKPGTATVCTHTLKRITRRPSTQLDFDHASANGITVTTWRDNGIHVAVYDEATGSFYQTGATALAGTSSCFFPRCVALGAKVMVFYAGGSSLFVAIVDTANPEATPTPITLQTDVDAGAYDAIAYGSSYVVVAYLIAGTPPNHVALFAVNSSGTVLSSPAKTTTAVTIGSADSPALFLHIDSNSVVYVGNTQAVTFPSGDRFATFSATTFAAVSSAGWLAISPSFPGGTGSYSLAFAEASPGAVTVFAAAYSPSSFMHVTVIGQSTVTTPTVKLNGTGGLTLQSDGFLLNGTPCCVVINESTLTLGASSVQPTAWVIDSGGNVLAKILPGTAYNAHSATNAGMLARTFTTSSGAIALLVGEQGRTTYTSQSGSIIKTTQGGVTRVNLSATPAGQVPNIRLGQAVYIGGSLPRIFDGQEVVEAGHNIFPEGVTAAPASGSNLSVGQYQYRVVYSWMNARGELQRSVPSPAATLAISSGANQAATLTIPTQRLCGRDAVGISTTQIEVYRTEANGLNFYRASSVSSPLLNDVTQSTVTFTDSSVTDAQLIANELLYTTGGVNDNPAPPAYTIACAHKTRMAIAGLDNPYEYRTSSVTIEGEMLRWNEGWGGFVPEATGPITGLASMDGNLFAFTTDAAYLVQGDGPDLLGNNNWPPPQLVTSVDAGAQSALSVVTAPDGIWFQSKKGLARLDRSLGFTYAGADVEAYGLATFRAAVLRPEVEQLWFHVDSGNDATFGSAVALVWDYHYSQWSVLTGANGATLGAQDACYWQGAYCRVNSSGQVLKESASTYLQNGTAISTVVETEWMKLAGLQGFARLWRALLLGAYGTDFTLTWDAAYNYVNTYNAADTVTVVGNGTYTVGGPFQLRRLFRLQKCESVKFRFADSAIGGNGLGMGLSDLTLVFGVRQGAWKLPPAQSVG